jgi:hypothetical protein
MNEHNEVLDELMGISDLDDRERYKLEQDIISCIKRNQIKRDEAEEENK